MNTFDRVAVCSRSFSGNLTLRNELLKRYKNVTFNEEGRRLEGESLVDFLRGHTKAISALERIDKFILSQLPELKVISKYGVGVDMIDMDAMREYQKHLGWTGGVNRRSVSELVIAFTVMMLRNLPTLNKEIMGGVWRQSVGGLLSGKTVGVVGCGNIGKDLIQLLTPWGCDVLVYDIVDYSGFYSKYKVRPVGLDELLINSDVVTLHIPLHTSTENIINAQRFDLMKTSAILINTARGGLVDEKALKNALKNRIITAAAFDVFTVEPPQDIELLELDNFFSTPHIGGSSVEAILAMGKAAISGLDENKIP